MLTKDERALMVATICLHGFQLYERFDTDGVWRPLLIGRWLYRQGPYEYFESVITKRSQTGDTIGPKRSVTGRTESWQRHHWFKLTDRQLTEFHRTVISTC